MRLIQDEIAGIYVAHTVGPLENFMQDFSQKP
jgi:hypothetical protein